MTVELYLWAPDRASFLAAMVDNGFLTIEKDGTELWHPEIQVDEIGPIMKRPPVFDDQDNIVTPAVMIPGHHVNLRGFGRLLGQLTAGKAQEGSIFERSRILETLKGPLSSVPKSQIGVPAGYRGPHGVVIYDPASILTPFRVWA
jgi:hypothetical protein